MRNVFCSKMITNTITTSILYAGRLNGIPCLNASSEFKRMCGILWIITARGESSVLITLNVKLQSPENQIQN